MAKRALTACFVAAVVAGAALAQSVFVPPQSLATTNAKLDALNRTLGTPAQQGGAQTFSNYDGGVSVVNFPASQPVTGTFWQATQPVSAASLPLPTGAALDSSLTTTNTKLSTIITNIGAPFQSGGNIGNTSFGISGTLPSFTSTPTFNIGTISTIATAANQTAAAASTPTTYGMAAQPVTMRPTTATLAPASVALNGATPVHVYTAASGVCQVLVCNRDTSIVDYCGDTNAVSSSAGITMPVNACYYEGDHYGGDVWCVSASGTPNVSVQATSCP